ncbi:MAG TPA: class I SAM-dependent methyltransferase [Candidatus Limnocylindrales bacterium]|nr:class I SAM-dependent methyltransferase [Candidatus Limnocylindrales bacterium]
MSAPSAGFDSAYRGIAPPWDIGRPQPVFVRLLGSGEIRGSVLDVGCGTGENVLFLAERGLSATGIDGAPAAIEKARAKAQARGLDAHFTVADGLDLAVPAQPFDTVIDCGFFHVLADDERPRYLASLSRVLRPGGTLFLLGFSDRQPGVLGPRRLTEAEIRRTFQDGWRVAAIHPAVFELTHGGAAQAWLASIQLAERA